jgi:hypothetical protein
MLSNESNITNAIEVLGYGEKFNDFVNEFNISVSNFVNEFNEVIDNCLYHLSSNQYNSEKYLYLFSRLNFWKKISFKIIYQICFIR